MAICIIALCYLRKDSLYKALSISRTLNDALHSSTIQHKQFFYSQNPNIIPVKLWVSLININCEKCSKQCTECLWKPAYHTPWHLSDWSIQCKYFWESHQVFWINNAFLRMVFNYAVRLGSFSGILFEWNSQVEDKLQRQKFIPVSCSTRSISSKYNVI